MPSGDWILKNCDKRDATVLYNGPDEQFKKLINTNNIEFFFNRSIKYLEIMIHSPNSQRFYESNFLKKTSYKEIKEMILNGTLTNHKAIDKFGSNFGFQVRRDQP